MQIGFFMSEYQSGDDGKSNGGLASYTKNIVNALKMDNHDAFVLTREVLERNPLTISLSAVIDKYLFPAVYWERSVSNGIKRKVKELLNNSKIDILQVPEYNGGAAELRKIGLPLVVRFHTPSFFVDQLNGRHPSCGRRRWYNLEGRGIAAADALTSSSSALRGIVCNYYKINPERVTVIRNPVDTDYFAPSTVSKATGQFRILFCGRLEERKGMWIIEKILPDLLNKISDLEILFAGEDTGRNNVKYEKIFSDIAGDKKNRLQFKGHVTREDLLKLYSSADLFIIPSLFDNSPNSLFEAMACGLPCIGSRVGGIDEIITDGENGLLFDTSKPLMLADYVFELYKDHKKRKTMGEAARNHMLNAYSMKSAAKAHIDFYSHL